MRFHISADIQAIVFHRRAPTAMMNPRGHALLHPLANRPVLTIGDVPESNGILGQANPQRTVQAYAWACSILAG